LDKNLTEEVAEMLEGLAFALQAAATLVRDGDHLSAITAAMAANHLLGVTGPFLLEDATAHGHTAEATEAAMLAGVVLTSDPEDEDAQVFGNITPDDFA
jgi:hypothetical protein